MITKTVLKARTKRALKILAKSYFFREVIFVGGNVMLPNRTAHIPNFTVVKKVTLFHLVKKIS